MASNDKYAIVKNVFVAVLITVSLFSMFFITQENMSWIKLLTIGLLGVGGVIWLSTIYLLRRTKFWRAVKHTLVIVSIFALSFSAFEGYMFQNAGHPPTFGDLQSDNTIKHSGILNASVTEIAQDIKNTPIFGLLMIEHPGKVSATCILLKNNSIEVGFGIGSACFSFKSSNGEPYHVSRVPILTFDSVSNQMNIQSQIPEEEAFQQIDSLGLQWFYNQAIEAYQKQTDTTPEINELEIQISLGYIGVYDKTYQGWILNMNGSYKNEYMNMGSFVFYANFQPDGTLNYFNSN
jgi:hypothetical protein